MKQRDPEYREYVAKLIVDEGRVAREVAHELEIPASTIGKWVKNYRQKKLERPGNEKYLTPSEVDKLQKQHEKELLKLKEENEILKKGYAHLHQKPNIIYRFIQAHQDEHTVVMMCRVLSVSKSGYYKWLASQDQQSGKDAHKKVLRQKIKKSFHESGGTYGSPRIHHDLVEWGYSVSQKTVARMMGELGLRATLDKKFAVTTDSAHALNIYPNRLSQAFTVVSRNVVWVADITYIWTLEGWVYLASVMDLYSRKIVGWAMDKQIKQELPLQALNRALTLRQPSKGFIHHSDRGSQYCSKKYIETLKDHQAEISMSRKGNPYDNACIESFHASIKKDLIYRRRFKTRSEAVMAVNVYISKFYNERRKHSTLGYCSPNQFERNAKLAASLT